MSEYVPFDEKCWKRLRVPIAMVIAFMLGHQYHACDPFDDDTMGTARQVDGALKAVQECDSGESIAASQPENTNPSQPENTNPSQPENTNSSQQTRDQRSDSSNTSRRTLSTTATNIRTQEAPDVSDSNNTPQVLKKNQGDSPYRTFPGLGGRKNQ